MFNVCFTFQGMELHCLKLVMLLHTVQLVHSLTDFQTSHTSSSTLDPLQKIVSVATTRQQGNKVRADSVSSAALYATLEELALPFLRSTVLFFQHFTDVTPGQDLVEDGGYSYDILARCVHSFTCPETIILISFQGTLAFLALCSSLLSLLHPPPFSRVCSAADQLGELLIQLLPCSFRPRHSTSGKSPKVKVKVKVEFSQKMIQAQSSATFSRPSPVSTLLPSCQPGPPGKTHRAIQI